MASIDQPNFCGVIEADAVATVTRPDRPHRKTLAALVRKALFCRGVVQHSFRLAITKERPKISIREGLSIAFNTSSSFERVSSHVLERLAEIMNSE
jgi:hypothetical protein